VRPLSRPVLVAAFGNAKLSVGDEDSFVSSWADGRIALTNDRPDLSSERPPDRDKTATFRKQPSDRK
jgi:hypothetical protein